MMTTDSVPTPGAPNVVPQDPPPDPENPPVPTDPQPLDNPPPVETPTPTPTADDDDVIDLRSRPSETASGFLPSGPARLGVESVFVRLIATAGIVGVATALGAILGAADV